MEKNYSTNNYMLVKMIRPAETVGTGDVQIALSQQYLGPPRWAHVLSIGEGLADINGTIHKPNFEVGDLIFVNQHGPEKCDYTDEGLDVLHIVSEGDVFTKLKIAADGSVTLIPCGNWIHIEPMAEDVDKKTKGGIFLPQVAREKPSKAKVISVGPGQRTAGDFFAPSISPGDIVRYRVHSPFVITFEDLGVKEAQTFLISYGDIVGREYPGFEEDIKGILDSLPSK